MELMEFQLQSETPTKSSSDPVIGRLTSALGTCSKLGCEYKASESFWDYQ